MPDLTNLILLNYATGSTVIFYMCLRAIYKSHDELGIMEDTGAPDRKFEWFICIFASLFWPIIVVIILRRVSTEALESARSWLDWRWLLSEEYRAHLIECQSDWLGSSPTWRTHLKVKFLTLGFLLSLLRGHLVDRLLKPFRPLKRPRI